MFSWIFFFVFFLVFFCVHWMDWNEVAPATRSFEICFLFFVVVDGCRGKQSNVYRWNRPEFSNSYQWIRFVLLNEKKIFLRVLLEKYFNAFIYFFTYYLTGNNKYLLCAVEWHRIVYFSGPFEYFLKVQRLFNCENEKNEIEQAFSFVANNFLLLIKKNRFLVVTLFAIPISFYFIKVLIRNISNLQSNRWYLGFYRHLKLKTVFFS